MIKKLINFRTIIGLLLILVALYPAKQPVEVALLNIEKPSQEIIEMVTPMSGIVTDPTDRAKLAIFNQEFANRVKRYDADVQQVNDVYVLSGGYFFKDELKDKYDELDKIIMDLMQRCSSSDNHKLTTEEKNKLSSYFMGFAWSLIQKR
jgi:hypothetical protein